MHLKSFLAPVAVAAVVAVPGSAFAQLPGWPGSGTAQSRYAAEAQAPYYEARRVAYDEGYREGLKEGELDARRNDRFGYQDERDFQRADRGYHRSFGDRDRYRQIFRDGFAAGYSDGYSRLSQSGRNRRSGPYYGSQGPYGPQGPYQGPYGQRGGYGAYGGGYYSPAFENGARDGYEKGREDARKNRSYDPLRHSWYRGGDRHYENRYGSREQYKDVYRRGFQDGYERGFREGRYR